MTNFFINSKVIIYATIFAIIYIIGLVLHIMKSKGVPFKQAIKEITLMDIIASIGLAYVATLFNESLYPAYYK